MRMLLVANPNFSPRAVQTPNACDSMKYCKRFMTSIYK